MHNQTLTEITDLGVTQLFVYALIGTRHLIALRPPWGTFEGIMRQHMHIFWKQHAPQILSFSTSTTKWEQMGVDYKAAITAYDAQCVVLLVQGVAKNQLPKKPKRSIKPKEVELSESEAEIEGSDEDDDNE